MSKGKPKGNWMISIGMLIFGVVYVISPFDLVPDAPVVGWLDDIAVMLGSVSAMLATLPRRKRDQEESLAGESEGE